MHLKGIRFGLPLVKRLGLIKHLETYRVAWNRHPGLEIHYVLKGDIAWELHGRKEPLAVSGGTFGIIPAKARHRALDNKGTPAFRLGVILEEPAPGLESGTPFVSGDLERLYRRFRENGGRVRRFTRRLSETLRDVVNALTLENATHPDGQLRLRTAMTTLLYETYTVLGETETLSGRPDVIPQVCKWIDAHFAEKITLPRLIRLSGYGRSRFFSLFLADTGMTPNDYLTRVRIERAKQRLAARDRKETILDLGLACGFNSAAAFATTFRKYTGVSPRTYAGRGSDPCDTVHVIRFYSEARTTAR